MSDPLSKAATAGEIAHAVATHKVKAAYFVAGFVLGAFLL